MKKLETICMIDTGTNIFIFMSYAFASNAEVRIINSIPETGFNILIDGELVVEKLKQSKSSPKPISIPAESIISILNGFDLIYEGKLSFKEKGAYDIFINKSDGSNDRSAISLSAVNVRTFSDKPFNSLTIAALTTSAFLFGTK